MIEILYKKGAFTVTATVKSTPTTIVLNVYDKDGTHRITNKAMSLISTLKYSTTFQTTSSWPIGNCYAIVHSTGGGFDDYSEIEFPLEELHE